MPLEGQKSVHQELFLILAQQKFEIKSSTSVDMLNNT